MVTENAGNGRESFIFPDGAALARRPNGDFQGTDWWSGLE